MFNLPFEIGGYIVALVFLLALWEVMNQ